MADDVKNVFISHIHEDDAVLPQLKDLVCRNGCEIRDGSINSSKPNEATDEEYIKYQLLAPQIRWASTLVVLISPETCKHWWVDWEIEYAEQQGKRIVGVWDQGAKDCDIPANLDKYADAVVGWQGDRIADAVTGKLNNWYNADGQERPARAIARWSCG
ncbi:MAG: TIR domain-containing protein [Terriglobales bacterium]